MSEHRPNTAQTIAGGAKTLGGGYFFGIPVGDLGGFASLLIGLACGFLAFFLLTFVGIMSILFWNAAGHHADITLSYRRMGLPGGLLVGGLALGYLGTLRVKRMLRKA